MGVFPWTLRRFPFLLVRLRTQVDWERVPPEVLFPFLLVRLRTFALYVKWTIKKMFPFLLVRLRTWM